MTENIQGTNQTQNSGAGDAGAGAKGGDGAGAPPQRPEYVPEQFWDGEKGAPKIEDLAKGYSDLAARQAKGKAALIPEIKKELETERFKARPAKAEDYKIAPPKGELPNNLVMLTEPPGADFKPEEGKRYFQVKADDPLMKYWRDTAHKAGLSNDEFMQGIIAHADSLAPKVPTKAETDAALNTEYSKLGEHGAARVAHTFNTLKATIGDKHAAAIDAVPLNAAAIEAIEALVEKAGGPKFAPQGGGGGSAGAPTMEDVRNVQADPNYWSSPKLQQQARDMIGKIRKAGGSKAA